MAHQRIPARPGQRFNRLIAVERFRVGRSGAMWICRCDCGVEKVVDEWSLTRGRTKSCGCFRRTFRVSHGASKTLEYRSWLSMMHRCLNPRSPDYPNYGGRGIAVCERWHTFTAFRDDMGPRTGRDYSLERLDVNGHYEPSNVIWANAIQQNSNQRTSRTVRAFGQRKTIAQWARDFGINRETVRSRLSRGWPLERALTIHRGTQ